MSEEVWPPAPLNPADVGSRVLKVVRSVIGIDDLSIEASLNLAADLDSLEGAELIMSLEEEFSIEIPNGAAQQLFSRDPLIVRDVIEMVLHYVHGR